jgi:site-specific recombinase XerD
MTPILESYKNYITVENSGQKYLTHIPMFLNFCEANNIDFRKISRPDIDKFLLTLRGRNLQNGTLNLYFKALRHFYRFLLKYNFITEDDMKPILTLKLLKVDVKKKLYITKEELDEIIEMGASFCEFIDPLKLKVILYFLFYSGVRKDEFLKLKRENIDIENCKALIKTPVKNKEEEYVYFPVDFAPLLKTYFDRDPEQLNAFNMKEYDFDYLFTSLKQFSPKGKPFHAHILRHSFAYMLMKKIKDIRILQKLLRHKSLESTMVYYDPYEEDVREAYFKNVKDIGMKDKKKKRKKK